MTWEILPWSKLSFSIIYVKNLLNALLPPLITLVRRTEVIIWIMLQSLHCKPKKKPQVAFYYGWNKIQTARPTIKFVFCQLSPASHLHCYILNCTSEIPWLILVRPIFSCSFLRTFSPQLHYIVYFIYSSDDVVVESLEVISNSVTQWTAARQASLPFTVSQSLLKFKWCLLRKPLNSLTKIDSCTTHSLPYHWSYFSHGSLSTSKLTLFIYCLIFFMASHS